jgi:hypothetical protein
MPTLEKFGDTGAEHILCSYLAPPTDDAYLAACKKRKLTPNSEILEDGTRAHWIGSSMAEKLIVNFHGTYTSVRFRAGHADENRWWICCSGL